MEQNFPGNGRLKRLGSLCFLFVVCCFLLTGCSEEWKRKFIRKKKDAQPIQAILVLHSGEKALHPPRARYREHFAFWKSWHKDLLLSLGEMRKRDLRYLGGAVGELRSMLAVLSPGEPADQLREVIIELSDFQERWENRPTHPWRVSIRERSRLEQLKRLINKKYHYSKLETHILQPEPEEEEKVASVIATKPGTPTALLRKAKQRGSAPEVPRARQRERPNPEGLKRSQ